MLASVDEDPFESDPCMPELPSSSRALPDVERPDKPLKSSLYCFCLRVIFCSNIQKFHEIWRGRKKKKKHFRYEKKTIKIQFSC
jgi:hypothetical protein